MAFVPVDPNQIQLDQPKYSPVDISEIKLDEPSKSKTALDYFNQGTTLGAGDEITDLLGALGAKAYDTLSGEGSTAGQNVFSGDNSLYNQARDLSKTELKQEEKANPKTALAANIAAGILPTIIAGGTNASGQIANWAGDGNLAARLGKGALVGAVPGGIYGFNTGTDGLGNRLLNTPLSAATSGILGGAVNAAAPSVLDAAQALSNKLTGTTTVSPVFNETAAQKVLKKLQEQFPDSGEQNKFLSDYANSNIGLGEMGGKPLQRLARGAAQFPSGDELASNYLGDRLSGVSDRIKTAIANNISPNTDYYGTLDDIVKNGMKKAAPLYEKANANTVNSEDLTNFIKQPELQAGIKKGLQLERLDSLANGTPFNPNDYAITDFNEAGDPIIGEVPNMRLLDAGKKGLDAMIAEQTDPVTGRTTSLGRSLTNFKKSYLNKIDEVNPDYAAARAAGGDYLSASQAMRDGNDFMSMDADTIKSQFKSYNPTQQQAFKAGMVKKLRDTIDNSGDNYNLYNKIMGKQEIRNKLQAVMTPDEYGKLANTLDAENKLYQFRNSFGNSITAAKLVDASEFMPEGLQFVQEAAKNGIKNTAASKVTNWIAKQFTGLSNKSAGEVSKILYETDPEKKLQLLQAMGKNVNKDTANKFGALYSVEDAIKNEQNTPFIPAVNKPLGKSDIPVIEVTPQDKE